jgi:putative DNA primase/helicase
VAAQAPSRPPPVPPEYSDDALALRFSDRHGDGSRYVALWGKWFHWNGSLWKPDATMKSFDLARAVSREASAELDGKPGLARAIANNKTVAAVVNLARSDRQHAAVTCQWDADPHALGAGTVTVDLTTGATRSPQRSDYITKSTAIAPGGNCPRWLNFLMEVTDGNTDLQEYLQRIAGYCLTGITSAHALFFLYGTGRNGKGVFLNTLHGVYGDYATTAAMETFVATDSDHHPTDLADLRGARLVIAQETEQGRRWAEAKIKRMTGGDPIKARFMRQDFFEYTPQFKLVIAETISHRSSASMKLSAPASISSRSPSPSPKRSATRNSLKNCAPSGPAFCNGQSMDASNGRGSASSPQKSCARPPRPISLMKTLP